MNKIGIIGCGSMGRMLVNRFLGSNVIKADQVIVSTLFEEKEQLGEVKKKYPGIEITWDNRELAKKSGRVFICVRPLEVKPLLEEIVHCLHPAVHLISIAASVTIGHIQRIFTGKISRLVPSITLTLDNGISLVCHNRYVEPKDAAYLEKMLEAIGIVKIIAEADIEVATNLTSTAPGLIAAIFRDFVEAGVKFGNFSKKEVEELVIASFHGTSAVFHEQKMKRSGHVSPLLEECEAGAEGEYLLSRYLPSIIDTLFDRTLGKFEEIKQEVTKQFLDTSIEAKPAIKEPG